MSDFTDRTPGSYLESGETCLTWYFKDADPDYGLSQAKLLQVHLEAVLHSAPARVLMGDDMTYVVVQPSRVHKGRALCELLSSAVWARALREMGDWVNIRFYGWRV